MEKSEGKLYRQPPLSPYLVLRLYHLNDEAMTEFCFGTELRMTSEGIYEKRDDLADRLSFCIENQVVLGYCS